MKHQKTTQLLILTSLMMTLPICAILLATSSSKYTVTVETIEKQIVLYTLYRGPYEHIGPAVQNLYVLAGQKNLTPQGPPTLVYLNDPRSLAPEHWLTEIRFPVHRNALKQTGTLGPFTDVKETSPLRIAAVIKEAGIEDSGPLYQTLYAWIYTQGFHTAGGPFETFYEGAETNQYAQMKSRIAVPIIKL